MMDIDKLKQNQIEELEGRCFSSMMDIDKLKPGFALLFEE